MYKVIPITDRIIRNAAPKNLEHFLNSTYEKDSLRLVAIDSRGFYIFEERPNGDDPGESRRGGLCPDC